MNLFVITAYRLDQLYAEKRSIVERLARKYKMQAYYAMFQAPLLHGGFNLLETQRLIEFADFIIADLTYERPSCYYELGFAQGLRKPVDLIAFESSHAEYIPPPEVLNIDTLRTYRSLATYATTIEELLRIRYDTAPLAE